MKEAQNMDLVLIAAGGVIAYLGSRFRDHADARTPAGAVLLGIGGLVLVVGLAVFMVAFVWGVNEGMQQSR